MRPNRLTNSRTTGRNICCGLMVLFLAGCGEPKVMLPGGKLTGRDARPPELWVNVPDVVQVEFRPQSDPYSVNVWAVGIDRDLYIATGHEGTRWTAMLEDDQDVRVRIDQELYELSAVPVADQEERLRVHDRYVKKYDIDTESDMLQGALVYRLDRRPAE